MATTSYGAQVCRNEERTISMNTGRDQPCLELELNWSIIGANFPITLTALMPRGVFRYEGCTSHRITLGDHKLADGAWEVLRRDKRTEVIFWRS